jgi:hypothetical protein
VHAVDPTAMAASAHAVHRPSRCRYIAFPQGETRRPLRPPDRPAPVARLTTCALLAVWPTPTGCDSTTRANGTRIPQPLLAPTRLRPVHRSRLTRSPHFGPPTSLGRDPYLRASSSDGSLLSPGAESGANPPFPRVRWRLGPHGRQPASGQAPDDGVLDGGVLVLERRVGMQRERRRHGARVERRAVPVVLHDSRLHRYAQPVATRVAPECPE